MSYPKTRAEMKAQGYIFSNHAPCRGCRQEIEWWETPKKKKIPMNPMASDLSQAIAHWATCVDAQSFRR